MKKERKQTFETYNHRILWGAAEKNLQLCVSSNKDAKFFALSAMFLFFAAFEGYLNWLGTRIATEVWEDERTFFSRDPYRGTLGKYRFLAKILQLPAPSLAQGAFKTVTDLLKLRDMVAHPKPEAGERPVKIQEGYFPQRYQGELERRVSPNAANRAKNDIEQLAEELHSHARGAYSAVVHESTAFGPVLEAEITDV